MIKPISFRRYIAGVGIKRLTFYYEPDGLKEYGGPVARVVSFGPARLVETALDVREIEVLISWLRKVIK